MFLKSLEKQDIKQSIKTEVTTHDLLEIIKEARNGELCRDVVTSARAFAPIWSNTDEGEPEFPDNVELPIKAEILRLAGFFLSYSGKTMNRRNYQERAKDLLTQSMEIFLDCNLKDKADEANIMLALCYWYAGAFNDCEIILSSLESEYSDKSLNSAYLQVKITRAITHWTKDEFKEALNMVETLRDSIDLCTDNRLKMMYHNQAGAMYLKLNHYGKALDHFKDSITYSVAAGSPTFEATSCNNLANLYKDLGKTDPNYFEQAFIYVEKARVIFARMNAVGWMPMLHDTLCQIYYEQKQYNSALRSITEGIRIARKGDDHSVIADCLFQRVKVYIQMDEPRKAMADFVELSEICRVNVGEFRLNQFTTEFLELIYFRKNLSLLDELKGYKKFLVSESLVAENFHREKSADRLGIERGSLYDIIEDEFPELYSELGFTKRNRTPSMPKPPKSDVKNPVKPQLKLIINTAPEKLPKIQKMTIPVGNISAPFVNVKNDDLLICFLLPEEFSGYFGIADDVIVLCNKLQTTPIEHRWMIVQNKENKEFLCVTYFGNIDGKKMLHKLHSESLEGVPANICKIIGSIVGICPLREATGDLVIFRSFTGVL